MSEQTSITRPKNAARPRRRSAAAVDHDTRAIRTYEALAAALTALVATKPLHLITVSELVDTAGVHRTTFYGHYPDLFALAAELCTQALDQLVAAATLGDADYFPQMLTHILEHRPLYRLVFGPLDVGFRRTFRQQAATIVSTQATDPITTAFLAGALAAVLDEWAGSESTDIAAYVAGVGAVFPSPNIAR